MKIQLTQHASQQMLERGITLEQIKRCIKQGSKKRQGKNEFLSSYSYYDVAYVQKKDSYRIKTVMIR